MSLQTEQPPPERSLAPDSTLGQNEATTERPRLAEKTIKYIEQSPIFVTYKMELLLVGLGEKPAAFGELESEEWRPGENPKQIDSNEYQEYVKIARHLGLFVHAHRDRTKVGPDNTSQLFRLITFSGSESTLTRLDQALAQNDVRTTGKLLGYPPTATDAFMQGRIVRPVDSDTNPATLAFAQFALSPENAHAELDVARRWSEAVRQSSPQIYAEMIEASESIR